MRKIIYLLRTVMLITFCSSAVSSPSINIGAMYEFIEANQNTLLKRVNNHGDSTAFVRVSVSEVIFDESGNQTEKELDTDAIMRNSGEGLVASPARMIVPAGSSQINRLLFIGSRDRERYFRVRFVPVVPNDNTEFGLTEKEMKEYNTMINAGISVLSGYGGFFFIRPVDIKYDTKIENTSKQFTITNNGNTTVKLEKFVECDADLKNCQAPSTKYLIPGRSIFREIRPKQSYQFNLVEGTKTQTISFGQI